MTVGDCERTVGGPWQDRGGIVRGPWEDRGRTGEGDRG